MPLVNAPETLSPREAYMLEHEKQQEIRQMEYGLKMKQLDIEVEKLQARWRALLKLPLFVLRLPLLLLLAVAYIIHVIVKKEPSDNFWNLLK